MCGENIRKFFFSGPSRATRWQAQRPAARSDWQHRIEARVRWPMARCVVDGPRAPKCCCCGMVCHINIDTIHKDNPCMLHDANTDPQSMTPPNAAISINGLSAKLRVLFRAHIISGPSDSADSQVCPARLLGHTEYQIHGRATRARKGEWCGRVVAVKGWIGDNPSSRPAGHGKTMRHLRLRKRPAPEENRQR